MGKRIIQQARGKGSHTYKVRKKAFKHRIAYPKIKEGEATILKLIHSAGHSSPLMKIKTGKEISFIPAAEGLFEGQKILFGTEIKAGNVVELRNIPVGTQIFNIESRPFDGGKFMRSAGSSATVNNVGERKAKIVFSSKKRKELHLSCRATIGKAAGHGRLEKPFVKAGNKFHLKKAKSKLWPRTSAIKMNAIDHPFGSGRGKHPKSKIAKRNAPPGAKVGLIRPSRTGKKKK